MGDRGRCQKHAVVWMACCLMCAAGSMLMLLPPRWGQAHAHAAARLLSRLNLSPPVGTSHHVRRERRGKSGCGPSPCRACRAVERQPIRVFIDVRHLMRSSHSLSGQSSPESIIRDSPGDFGRGLGLGSGAPSLPPLPPPFMVGGGVQGAQGQSKPRRFKSNCVSDLDLHPTLNCTGARCMHARVHAAQHVVWLSVIG